MIDNTDVQSEQWCITYLVGFDSPDIIRPTTVQGSASPLGTIFQNHTLFSIQSNDILYKDLILTDRYLFILIDFQQQKQWVVLQEMEPTFILLMLPMATQLFELMIVVGIQMCSTWVLR